MKRRSLLIVKVAFISNQVQLISKTGSNSTSNLIEISLFNLSTITTSVLGGFFNDVDYDNFLIQCIREYSISPIDFDDCGHGFHMYDLAVTLTSLEYGIKQGVISRSEYKNLSESFLKSYDRSIPLREEDLSLLEDMKIARRFLGTQWLNLRADNPKLKKRSIPYAKETVHILKRKLKL